MIFTKTQVQKMVGYYYPETVEMPTSFKTIGVAEELLAYMDKKGIPVSLRHSSTDLWKMGEKKASEYVQQMLDVVYTIDADMRVQDSRL